MDVLNDIIDAMKAAGCAPARTSEIIVDDKKRRYSVYDDKKGKKSGEYRFGFLDNGDRAYGWFINYKGDSIVHKYATQRTREYTPEERAAWKKEIKAKRAKAEKELKESRAEAAEFAAKLWKGGRKADPDHDYLKKKQIAGKGAKILPDGELIIPAYKDGKLTTVQRIYPSGDKLFLESGDIQGAYGSIGAKAGTDLMYIAEGYATAHSIHDATGKCTVYAFNKGNIFAVAESLKNKYPDSEIIICADNDQWTTKADNVTKYNPGIEAAFEAQERLGLKIIWPDFDHEADKGLTDFNDYAIKSGLDPLKNRLHEAGLFTAGEIESALNVPDYNLVTGNDKDSTPPPPVTSYPMTQNPPDGPDANQNEFNWRQLIEYDDNGLPVKGKKTNAFLALLHSDSFYQVFRWNDFHKEVYVSRPPPWGDPDKFRVRIVNDNDITMASVKLEQKSVIGLSGGLSCGFPDTKRLIKAVAMDEINSYNPAVEFLDSLEWDGVERLDTWLQVYMGASRIDPEEYLAFIGKKWMTAAAKRVYEPGCKFDHVLCVSGEQGVGKSAAFKELATFGDEYEESYFRDNINVSKLSDKDTTLNIQGAIIIELAELAGFNKKDDNEIKSWITSTDDRCRTPYDSVITTFKRQFVICATTNEYDYLKDPTGNRRYWPFDSCYVDVDAIARDKLQLWAEAVKYYKDGLYIGPTKEEMEMAVEAQKKRYQTDSWEEDIERIVRDIKDPFDGSVNPSKIMHEMGLHVRDRNKAAQNRVANVLRKMGYESRRIYEDGKRTRKWIKGEIKDDTKNPYYENGNDSDVLEEIDF